MATMAKDELAVADEELVLLAQGGDKQSREELFVRYASMVRRQVRGYFLVGGETEDLIQEGMLGLFYAVDDYKREEGKSFKNFAYLCVKRKIIDALKRSASKKNRNFHEGLSENVDSELEEYAEFDPDTNLILSDEWREMKVRIGEVLSDFEFKIFWMYMDGMTRAEICESTGKSTKSVDNAIERSKRKLRELLKK